MKKKIFGAPDENESIQLVFVPIEDYETRLLTMGDVKATCAHLYAKNMGLLEEFNKVKKQKPGTLIGVLGCMAERLKEKFLQEEKHLK